MAAPLPPPHPHRRSQGLTLPELVIGVTIGALVFTAGALILVPLLRSSSAYQRDLNRRGDLGRLLSLVQEEVRASDRIETAGATALSALSGCTTPPALILRGSTAEQDISYALVSRANTIWFGPSVLVRCGVPYLADGSLDTSQARSEEVVLDQLQAGGFSATVPASGSATVTRNLTLTLTSDTRNNPISSVQIPITANSPYGLLTTDGACLAATGDANSNCWVGTPGATIQGNPGMEDVLYIDGLIGDYTISGTTGVNGSRCTTNQCTITRAPAGQPVRIAYGDVLVFRDGEIRIPGS